ncbi:MAG: hypothetical protein WAU08_04080, partial [Flavobacteriales bacterium]
MLRIVLWCWQVIFRLNMDGQKTVPKVARECGWAPRRNTRFAQQRRLGEVGYASINGPEWTGMD